jgi:spore coat protein U-like protein
MRALLIVLLALACLVRPGEARAQSCTATAPDIYFGNVSTPVPQVNITSQVQVSCTGTPNTTVRICLGITPATYGARTMWRPLFNLIPYEIYSDPGRSVRWDDNQANRVLVTVPLSAAGSGTTTRSLYAQMPADGSPPSGLYQSVLGDDQFMGEIKPGNSGCSSASNAGFVNGLAFNASVFVNGTCNITVDPLLDFGATMGAIASPIDSSIALRATCNQDLPYTVALGDGLYATGTQRRMRSAAGGFVDYGLFQDAARSQRWGDGTPDPLHNGTGNGAQQTLTIFGRVPAGQSAPSGTYQDTVTATITY